MNKHFLCQLADAVRMNNNKQYVKPLDCINKQHNFIVLRTLYGDHYETEMHRSRLLEKLQHIHETLCFKSRTKPPTPYRYPVKLPHHQIDEACCIFEHIQNRLPKRICYFFVIYKILEQIITEEPQLRVLQYIQTKNRLLHI